MSRKYTDDICTNRHKDNPESIAANERNKHDRAAQRAQVLDLITSSDGLTMKEVAEIMGVQLNTISGRGTELKRDKLVAPTGEIRNGSAVLRATGITPEVRECAEDVIRYASYVVQVCNNTIAALRQKRSNK